LAVVLLHERPTLAAERTLLNVSYDPTRELYEDINKAFIKFWRDKTGETVRIKQSHGGSAKQARAVLDGLEADVVTLALAQDVDALVSAGLVDRAWRSLLPESSSPYTSTIVFLVRKGNPKAIHDWADLARPGVQVIPANPKTSGGARWTYAAAWAYAQEVNKGDFEKTREYVSRFYKSAPVLDSGARGATTTFVQRGIGDVLVGWESEAHLALKQLGADKLEIVTPSISILAEPPVAVVSRVAEKHGTRQLAEAYLRFLFSPEAQDLAAAHFYRPRDREAAKRHASAFPALRLVTIDQALGGWAKAQKEHFDDGAVFDQIYVPSR
jgi:sulfate transport system substrate-binding protein